MTRDPLICAGPTSLHIAEPLAATLGWDLSRAESQVFPDGETCMRISADLRGRELIIVQGTAPPQDRHLQQLYQLVEIAASLSPRSITCLVPYLAYARQDRRCRAGEPLSVNIIFRTLRMLGARAVITVELHNPTVSEQAPLPVHSLGAETAFASFVESILAPENPVLVSPDRGGSARVGRIATITGWPSVILSKNKSTSEGTWYDDPLENLSGKDAVVIDDLCSSGSTLAPLSRVLERAGCRSQNHLFAHFLGNYDLVRTRVPEGVRLVATDTIPSPISQIPITGLLAAFLQGPEGRRSAS